MKVYIREKGITLIALIITIIILIILAAVTINSIVQMNMIEKALGAAEDYNTEQQEEEKKLQSIEKIIEELEENLEGNGTNSVIYYVDVETYYEEKVKRGESCLLPKSFEPQKEGWKFIGWSEGKTAEENILVDKKMESKPVTLYAIYEKEMILSYQGNNSNSGQVSEQRGTAYYNGSGMLKKATLTVKENEFIKAGSTFRFWATEIKADEGYKAGETIELSNDTTLYAKWTTQLFPNNLQFDLSTNKTPGTVTCTKTTMSRSGCTGSNCDVYMSRSYDFTGYQKIYINYTISNYVGMKANSLVLHLGWTPITTNRTTAGTYTEVADISSAGNSLIRIVSTYWNFVVHKIWIE